MTLSRILQEKEAQAMRLYAATKDTSLVPPKTYVNSVMQGACTGNRMQSTRDGATDFLLIKSLGTSSPQLSINSVPLSVR